jgi:micrococcal nuclease
MRPAIICALALVGCSETAPPLPLSAAPGPSVAPIAAPTPKLTQGKPVVETFTGKVISLADADTITVLRDSQPVKIRLEGIDAPERTQEHATKATQALTGLIKLKEVTVEATGTDKYGRTLAVVMLDGESINEWLVSEGWAWHVKEYSSDQRLAELETQARQAKVGLWQHDSPIPPWEFRDIKRNGAALDDARQETTQPAPRGPPTSAKYWLNTSSSTRHNDGCRWFAKTKRGRYCGPTDGKACGICGG